MYRTIVIASLFATVLCVTVERCAAETPPAQLLEKAIYEEQAVGDLQAALQLYRKIVDDHQKSEAIAEQAQLRMGLIQLKLGNHEKAQKILQSLADKHPSARVRTAKANVIAPPVIAEVLQQIRAHYVDEIDDAGVLTEAALQGLLRQLDSYSSYLDAETLKNLHVEIDGQMVGIGAAIDLDEGHVRVTKPLPGSPARKAGVVAGDTIVAVDGEKTSDFPEESRLRETVKRCRGERGSIVRLQILSAGATAPKEVTVTRDRVKLSSVTGASRDGDTWKYMLDEAPEVAFIRIHAFTKETHENFRHAIRTAAKADAKGLIIDLRGAPGGLLPASLEVADMFLSDGKLLEVRERRRRRSFPADEAELFQGKPIVILVDRRTASAAEILAGTLQDRGRATIIGERTFGKGTVQALFPLTDGGAIKLTTARFYLPSGKNLEKPTEPSDDETWGVNPNDGFEIKSTEDQRKMIEERTGRFADDSQPVKIGNGDARDEALARAIEFLKAK